MTRRSLYFTAPGELEIRESEIPEPSAETVVVETEYSAISAGTEGLVYRGETPEHLATDGHVQTLVEDLSYPLQYGYAAVGRVTAVGSAVDDDWRGERVFAYHPHESHFLAEPAALLRVPETLDPAAATLHANAETAVNFLLDGQPAIAERVTVFGQGVVGLLTTALLARMPLDSLTAVDPIGTRLDLAREFGATATVSPATLSEAIDEDGTDRPDLVYELSGDPTALNDAMGIAGYDARIVVGSWYGTKPAALDFGGRFHHHRLDITSSQVSTIAPEHEGRWSRDRRHEVAWERLEQLPVAELITHELPIDEAATGYELLEESPDEAVQVVIRYQ